MKLRNELSTPRLDAIDRFIVDPGGWRGKSTILAVAAAAVVFIVGLGLLARGGLWPSSLFGQHAYSPIDLKAFEALAVKPIALDDAASGALAKLEREPCDKRSIYTLTESVGQTEERWAGDALVAFGKRCGALAVGDLRHAGDFYNRIGAFEEAINAENLALQYDDAHPDIFYIRGRALVGLKRWPEAIADFRRALAIVGQPKSTHALNWDLVAALRATGDMCGAAEALKQFIEAHPDFDLNQAIATRHSYRMQCDQPVSLGQILAPQHEDSPEAVFAKIIAMANADPDGGNFVFYHPESASAQLYLTRTFRELFDDVLKHHNGPEMDGDTLTQGFSETDFRIISTKRIRQDAKSVTLAVNLAMNVEGGSERKKTIDYFFQRQESVWKLNDIRLLTGEWKTERQFLEWMRRQDPHRYDAPTDLAAVKDPAPQSVAADASDKSRDRVVQCLLIVRNRTYLKGPCNFSPIGTDGSFSIGTGERGHTPYFAYIDSHGDGTADGYWNESPENDHADTSLGSLRRHGACWSNADAQVCAH